VKQVIIHVSKMNALKTGSLKPSDWILNPFDQSKHHFTSSKAKQNFQHLCKPIYKNSLNFSEQVCFEQTSK
jgi:hypothetical protein